MKEKSDLADVVNPKRALARREEEAEKGKKGVDAGDISGPNSAFFKDRDHSKDKEGLEKMLKNRK